VLKALALSTVLMVHGWYAPECCGGQDCKPVPCDSLEVLGDGSVLYKPTGATFDRARVRPSQDKDCHVCLHGAFGQCVYIQMGV
jgi:hypothetical protein